MKIQAIIAAAGAGTRLKRKTPKPLLKIKKKPILFYSLRVLNRCSVIHSVIVVTPPQQLKRFQRVVAACGFRKKILCIAGGARRCDSVKNGLTNLDQDTRYVLIHDGARPFLCEALVDRCIQEGLKHQAAVAGVKVKPTIKRVCAKTHMVSATLNREELWEAQTPQVFARDLLERAYSQPLADTPTDDAQLLERAGIHVKVVPSIYENIKITTPDDLLYAEYLLSRRRPCSVSA